MADPDRGAEYLDRITAARPRVVSATDKLDALLDLWDKGLPPGYRTGWPSVDALYTVVPGQLTIVSGWPSSGKSSWVDALLVNLARQGWRLGYYSPENMPIELHQAMIIEKLAGAPFGNGPTRRIERDELSEWADEMSLHFRFLEQTEDALSARKVLDALEPWLCADPAPRGLVIDPYNELDHWRPPGTSETEYVSAMLSHVRKWARKNAVHVWLVAHPQKVPREDGKLPIPKPDMTAGSQHFWNKSDCYITVYRDFGKLDSREISIYVQKVRFKHVGKIGMTTLLYDRVTGRYSEQDVAMRVTRV